MSWGVFCAYLSYIIRHKYFVYKACRLLGVGVWQALRHDWTKFKYSEYWPYAKFFYGMVKESPLVQEAMSKDFDIAWNYHQKHNRHHWQYWVLIKDSGELVPLPIPDRYLREMVGDWIGTGQTLGKPDTKAWYAENKDKIMLHPDSRAKVEEILAKL